MATYWTGRSLIAAFVGIAALSLVGAVAILGGGLVEIGYAAAGGIVVAIPVVGTYALGMRYGQPHSHAVATSAIVLGLVYTAAVVVNLLTQFGA